MRMERKERLEELYQLRDAAWKVKDAFARNSEYEHGYYKFLDNIYYAAGQTLSELSDRIDNLETVDWCIAILEKNGIQLNVPIPFTENITARFCLEDDNVYQHIVLSFETGDAYADDAIKGMVENLSRAECPKGGLSYTYVDASLTGLAIEALANIITGSNRRAKAKAVALAEAIVEAYREG